MPRPNPQTLLGKSFDEVPASCQRILQSAKQIDSVWIGPQDAAKLTADEQKAYDAAFTIMRHMAIQMPRAHKSGHPGGPLSAFTSAYWIMKLRDPALDQPLRYSPGHLSVLAYTLQYLFGRGGNDERLSSPKKLVETFRTPSGLPGHVEAGIGDIPFGTGPLGKGVSNALGVALGLKYMFSSREAALSLHSPDPLANARGQDRSRKVQPNREALTGTLPLVDVLLADGDAQEGQVMEAFRLAAALQLDHLIVHGDWNDMQLSEIASNVMASDFAAIAQASDWQVIEVQNGNDPAQVKAAILKANELTGKGRPIFICYYTTMGHGIALMEEGSNTGKKNFHGAPLSDAEAEEALKLLPSLDEAITQYAPFRKSEQQKYETAQKVQTDIPLLFDTKMSKGYERTVMTQKGAARKEIGATHLLGLMQADPRIIVLHADLAGSGGFDKVEKVFPDRCINVGVAEANMVMMASGMRQVGLLPVTYTFAAFGTNEARASARLIDINCGHTRCGILHNCTHTGLSVGEDGETHQERHYLDIPFDNTEVWMPADSNQAGAMVEKAMEILAEGHMSVFLFSPRSGHLQLLTEKSAPVYDASYVFDHRATLLHGQGTDEDSLTILATGITVHAALAAATLVEEQEKNVHIRVLNIASIRPLDSGAILQAALETQHLVVCEDHSSESGLAHQVADVIADFQLPCSLRRLGVNHYFPSAPADHLNFIAGLDPDGIANAVQDELRTEVCGGEDVLLSMLMTLPHHLKQSRFAEMAHAYAQRIKNESGYLEALRQQWQNRACDPDALPENERIREGL